MASSGAYTYGPTTGELVLAAYARIKVRRAEIINEHLSNATNEANLLQGEWANKGPTLWTVDLQTVPLVEGTISYSVPPTTVMVLDAWISQANGAGDDFDSDFNSDSGPDGSTTDRIITPLSRTEYASLPDKSQQGYPTSFWFDRLESPTISMWPVPDSNGPYTLKYYRFTQPQDALLSGGLQPGVPYLWLDAFVAGLAYRLARIYAQDLMGALKVDAKEAYDIAANQGVENVPYYIQPDTSGYWR